MFYLKKDIDINSEEICEILDCKPGKVISEVYDELKNVILRKELDNSNSSIREYIFNNRRMWLDEGAIIQGGSVVHGEIPPYAIAGGNPAKVFKYRNIEHFQKLKAEGKFY